MGHFQVISPFQPQGDQPQAIEKLAHGTLEGKKFQTLMGVTGSGKTFTMAHTIARINRPTLVISHNKTLAAQLYEEFKEIFPHNAVGYFVSYYDYYQPEAYIPQRDIYIEKDASRNDDLDRLRLSATSNLVSRNDVLLVASVSCIFGLGSPMEYQKSVLPIRKGVPTDRDEMLHKLIDLQYSRNDIDFKRATFRVRGDVVELHPSYEQFAYRIEFFGDQITNIDAINPLTGELLKSEESVFIYPAVHYVMPEDRVHAAVQSIRDELETRVMKLRGEAKLLEAQRLLARTKYDLEMMLEVGYCSGIENYSRHLDGRKPGEKPYTLVDYFPKDYLLIIDESHVTLPTKRLADDLSAYIQEAGIRGRYLHSEIQTLERVEILKDLRHGDFDVLVGVNLLREGLDLPEVSMVAILDADKAGFLRSETSLIQTIGRAARNVNAKVILYADAVTPAMKVAIDETNRRRAIQVKYNEEHGIKP